MRAVIALSLVAMLAACAGPPMAEQRSPAAEADLRKALAGRIPGPPVSCLPNFRANDMVVIDDSTILFKDGRRTYRNDFNGGSCSSLGSGHYALVTQSFGGTLCRGDIARVADLSSGMTVGSCVMGNFIPYTKPRS